MDKRVVEAERPSREAGAQAASTKMPCHGRAARNRFFCFASVVSHNWLWLLVSSTLLFCTPTLYAATNPLPMPQRMGIRTNALPGAARPNVNNPRTNIATLRPGQKPVVAGHTNAPAIATPAKAGWKENLLRLTHGLYGGIIGLAVALGALFLFLALKAKGKKGAKPAAETLTPSKLAAKPAKRPVHYHSCAVLEVGPQARQVWQFDARGRGYVLNRQQTCLDGDSLPSGLAGKDWRALFQPKLNIAWLPPEHAFLRVAQLPKSNFEETLAMVELQLEKLSPIPVNQIVWSFHTLPHAEGNLQTVIVSIVAREVVEEFLGKLEGQGYLADRLELPLIDQLQTTAITEDGAWVYPEAAGGKRSAVVAWWYGGVLQNLDLLTMPATEASRAASLKEQLMQMAWAGEMEGWLTRPPEWHLVADVVAGEWEPALHAGLEQPIERIDPVPVLELAALTAERSAHAEPRANLMPAEFTTRYQQQFVDRLWMRGLLAVGGLYTAGVAIYLIALWFFNFTTASVENQAAALAPNYTNAIQLEARFKVLRDRQDLKYAALDSWNATAHLLPESVTLDSLNFSEGKRLHLSGTAPSAEYERMLTFDRDMRRETKGDDTLFDPRTGADLQWRAPAATANWSAAYELKRSEVQ